MSAQRDTPAPPPMGTAFKTALGWCGLLWRDGAAVRLLIGHAHLRAVVAAMGAFRPADDRDAPHGLVAAVRAYARGERPSFDAVPLPAATPFAQRVWQAARAIPYGAVRTYGDLAGAVGDARLARAVGGALARNPLPLVVPCHRVIAAGGRVGGFSAAGGAALKVRLLSLEGHDVAHGRVARSCASRRTLREGLENSC